MGQAGHGRREDTEGGGEVRHLDWPWGCGVRAPNKKDETGQEEERKASLVHDEVDGPLSPGYNDPVRQITEAGESGEPNVRRAKSRCR